MSMKSKQNGRIYGRTRAIRKHNVGVYCDDKGWSRVELWSVWGRDGRRGSLKMTTEELRVLRKAIDKYLDA